MAASQGYQAADADEPTIDPDAGWDDDYEDLPTRDTMDGVDDVINIEEHVEVSREGPALDEARQEVFARYVFSIIS